MVWFWIFNHRDDTLPAAKCRRTNAPGEITGSQIVYYPGRLKDRDDSPMLELHGPNKKRIEKIVCLPTYTTCPLVDHTVQKVLSETVPSEEIQFLRAHVRWGDRIVEDFSFARPLNTVDCVDLDKTQITYWDAEGELFSNFERLVLKPNCMDGKHYIRTKYFIQVLISDEVKAALDEVNDGSMLFVRPEEIVPWYKDT